MVKDPLCLSDMLSLRTKNNFEEDMVRKRVQKAQMPHHLGNKMLWSKL